MIRWPPTIRHAASTEGRSGPATATNGGSPGFIDRVRELDALTTGLQAALDGRGRLLMVAGEAGIGKSRLLDELARRAVDRDAFCLWGRCWDGGGAPAYWPWIQVVRGLVQRLEPEQLREHLGPGAPYIAQVVPELRERFPDIPEAGSLDSDQVRFSLFDGVARLAANVGEATPLVILLDDLHAADEASLLLLQFLSRTLGDTSVLVVGAYREREAQARPGIAALLSDLGGIGQELPLRGLDRSALAALIESEAQDAAQPALVTRLHDLTEGNPFFAGQLVRLLLAEDAYVASRSDARVKRLPLPEGVREAIRRRIDPLPSAAAELLSLAAIIGTRFRLDTLAETGEADRAETLVLLDEAVAAGVVRELDDEIGRYAFCHALIRETLHDALPRGERARLHCVVGEALERLYDDATDAHLSELAYHFIEAAPVGDPQKALDYATRAAEGALDVFAYERAEELFTYALRALELAPTTDQARRCRLLIALGDAQMRAGDIGMARGTLREAAALARRLQAPELLAEAALRAAPWGVATGRVDDELVGLLEEALAALDESDSVLRALVLARLGATLYWADAAQRRAALADEAIAVARRIGDPATLASVLSDAHIATWGPESPERSLTWAEEIFARSEEVGDRGLALHALSWRITLLLELGDIAAAEQGIETFSRLAEEFHQQPSRSYVPLHRATRALIEGRYTDAELLIGEAADRASGMADDSIVRMLVAGQTFVMRWAEGRLGELEAGVASFADSYPTMPVWRCARCMVLRDQGRTEELRREVDRLAADRFAGVRRDNTWLASLAFLAEAATALDDEERAAALYELLAPFEGRNVVAPDGGFIGPVSRFLGILAATTGDWPSAAEHLEAARRAATAMSARPTLAHLCLDEARMLLRRDESGDRDAALRRAREGRALAEELGMTVIAERAAELVAAAGGEAAPEPAPAEAASPAAAAEAPPSLCCEGDYWTVDWRRNRFLVKDSKGLRYLARLLVEPETEFHALDLAGSPAAPRGDAQRARDAGLEVRAGGEDAGAVLDPEAKRAYRERVAELREELEEAEAFNDPERAARAREELEFIGRELAGAVGLGGRDRKSSSTSERARVNVTRAIRTAVERIGDNDPHLAHHLEGAVRTGTFCAYRPEPGMPSWTVRSPG
jgi:predicted ATPase